MTKFLKKAIFFFSNHGRIRQSIGTVAGEISIAKLGTVAFVQSDFVRN